VSLMMRLRTVLMCAALEIAVLQGAPMRPEEICELMQTTNVPKLAHVLPAENEDGDGCGRPAQK
jgi:hypothetical protein